MTHDYAQHANFRKPSGALQEGAPARGELPEFIPTRMLRGVAGYSANRKRVIDQLRRGGVELVLITGRGGQRFAARRDSLPRDVIAALLQEEVHASDICHPAWAELWRNFGKKTKAAQLKAQSRLDLLDALHDKIAAGQRVGAAVSEIAAANGLSIPTVERLRCKVRDVPRGAWLPALAPGHQSDAADSGAISADAWRFFLAEVNQSSAVRSLKAAYWMTAEVAAAEGWAWPSYVTITKRWNAIPVRERALLRTGPKAHDATIRTRSRSVAHLGAMARVNLDGRKVDVFARWEDGTIGRPIIIAIQDVYSRKVLGWVIAKTEDADSTKAAVLMVFDEYGLFDSLTTDNGRAFSSNTISGGASHRWRWAASVHQTLGILPRLGITVSFTKPYNGRAKPIERAFRDMARDIDALPDFKGAYCGNRPDAKPEDFTGTPIDIETFRGVYARGIAEHNARPGRRTEICKGKLSFDQAFAESVAQRAARPLTRAQRRYFMLDAVDLKPQAKTGALVRAGFTWWSADTQDAILAHRNEGVRVLFDPTDRSKPVMVEDRAGRVIAESVPCLQAGKFDSTEDAREVSRAKAQARKADRAGIAARNIMSRVEADVLRKRAYAARPSPAAPAAEASVTKPVFGALPRKGAAPRQAAPVENSDFQESVRRGLEKLKEARRAG